MAVDTVGFPRAEAYSRSRSETVKSGQRRRRGEGEAGQALRRGTSHCGSTTTLNSSSLRSAPSPLKRYTGTVWLPLAPPPPPAASLLLSAFLQTWWRQARSRTCVRDPSLWQAVLTLSQMRSRTWHGGGQEKIPRIRCTKDAESQNWVWWKSALAERGVCAIAPRLKQLVGSFNVLRGSEKTILARLPSKQRRPNGWSCASYARARPGAGRRSCSSPF